MTNFNSILSREEYIAAYTSKNVQDFINYRERIISELLGLFRNRLFPLQLDILRERFETTFQELVDATPNDIEILYQDFTSYGDHVLTLEEQRGIVLKGCFDHAFQKFKDHLQIVVSGCNSNNTRIFPVVAARI